MTITQSNHRPDYETVIVGNGPAAIGPFVAADRIGKLQEFLEGGVAVIGGGNHRPKSGKPFIGSGQLGRYQINSNSPARDFLEPLASLGSTQFTEALLSAEAHELRDNLDSPVFLPTVGRFIDKIGKRIETLLREHTACDLLNNTTVSDIFCKENRFLLQRYGGGDVHAHSVVLATGAKNNDGCSYGNLEANSCLKHPESLTDRKYQILGASHSAFSVANLILSNADKNNIKDTEIVIHFRSPIRLFFDLRHETPPSWYSFAQDDICHQTKRLHRFGGLRGDARALYLKIQEGKEGRVRLLPCAPDKFPEEIPKEEYGRVIDATGYVVNGMPCLYRGDEKELRPLFENAHLKEREVNSTGQVLDSHSNIIPNLYGIGLGYGIRPTPEIGGEKNFRGRLDGVNLYWGPIGERIVESILRNREKTASLFPSEE